MMTVWVKSGPRSSMAWNGCRKGHVWSRSRSKGIEQHTGAGLDELALGVV